MISYLAISTLLPLLSMVDGSDCEGFRAAACPLTESNILAFDNKQVIVIVNVCHCHRGQRAGPGQLPAPVRAQLQLQLVHQVHLYHQQSCSR